MSAAVAVIRLSVLAALLLLAVALVWFPLAGDTAWRCPYLCDLASATGPHHRPNPVGSVTVPLAQALLAIAMALTWQRVPFLFRNRPWLGAWVPRMGTSSALFQLLVPLTVPLRLHWLHAIVVFAAALPGTFAQAGATIGLFSGGVREQPWAVLGTVVALSAGVDLLLYALEGVRIVSLTSVVPALQLWTLVMVMGWMLGVAGRLARQS